MIEIKNLTKRFGKITAVDNISFTVEDGEIVGFLGPNGAGKSTTMNMMTGFISSTEGSVTIDGYDILEEPEKAKKRIGYLPEIPPVYPDMTVSEYLDFVCDLKKVKKSERKEMLREILENVRLVEVKDRLIKNLSKGYRQRVGLAQALVGRPGTLILDEPTVGLDPRQVLEMRDVIKTLGEKHTVILSSHILQEVSAVCSRVIIINKGKIVANGDSDGLSGAAVGSKLSLEIKGEKEAVENAFSDLELIESLEISDKGENLEVKLSGAEGADIREAVFKTCAEKGLVVLEMKNDDLSLEEVFMRAVSGSDEEAALEKERQAISAENQAQAEAETETEEAEAPEEGFDYIADSAEIITAEAAEAENAEEEEETEGDLE
ncbi:MAG: ABC transporter ATP-binding protein [Clostridiales bacterium]|nr:ABC transporter ATP-binding protein [Clostridiales bacterium]